MKSEEKEENRSISLDTDLVSISSTKTQGSSSRSVSPVTKNDGKGSQLF